MGFGLSPFLLDPLDPLDLLQQAKKIPATARGVGEADMKLPEIYVTSLRSFWQGLVRGIVSGYIQPS